MSKRLREQSIFRYFYYTVIVTCFYIKCISQKPHFQVNLSHNHISQIHKKTFPYSKWIPYRLEEVDLSSNRLAVIGRDFIAGMKDVKKLNIANNSIIDIRKCMLRNRTVFDSITPNIGVHMWCFLLPDHMISPD